MKTRNKGIAILGLGALAAFTLAGCGPSTTEQTNVVVPDAESTPISETTPAEDNAVTVGTTATAVLKPTKDNKIAGTVTFTKEADGIRVVADLTGLTPGEHGFHVHETGDCSAPDATSAGGHFNPSNMPHGAPDDAERHEGDLGNITADSAGKAHYDRVDKVLSFEGPDSIVGRAVIVHTGVDDLKSQPSGDAGGRGACGVIEMP